MAERRKVRSGTGGGTSTRSREPSDQDDQEILDGEPMASDEDELLDADEPEEADDEIVDADEPEAADEDESAGNGQRRPARRGGSAMTAGEAARAALRQIAELTAKQPEGVTGVERAEDGWIVGIELVEDRRIPSSADILATYKITIGPDGELLSSRRTRRYARGRGDTEEL